jgi:hypothetical protein
MPEEKAWLRRQINDNRIPQAVKRKYEDEINALEAKPSPD